MVWQESCKNKSRRPNKKHPQVCFQQPGALEQNDSSILYVTVFSRLLIIYICCLKWLMIKELLLLLPQVVVSSHTPTIVRAVQSRGAFHCSTNWHCHDRNSPSWQFCLPINAHPHVMNWPAVHCPIYFGHQMSAHAGALTTVQVCPAGHLLFCNKTVSSSSSSLFALK